MGLISMSYGNSERLLQACQVTPTIEVPLVRVHPETDDKQLFPCELYAQRVLGVPRIVSGHFLHIIFDYLGSLEDGVTLIWDNRILYHRGVFKYDGQQR